MRQAAELALAAKPKKVKVRRFLGVVWLDASLPAHRRESALPADATRQVYQVHVMYMYLVDLARSKCSTTKSQA